MRFAALVAALLVVCAGCAAPVAEGPDDGHADTDTLGWEQGYRYDDPIDVTGADGLNESERSAVIARAMARVERIRGLEFREPVNVTVVSRADVDFGGGGDDPAFETFDNAKFEALFLVGADDDSVGVQSASRNRTVLGYYSPAREAIVIVSDAETPTLDGEGTLAHELVHALQDQHFGIGDASPEARDAYNAHNGLVEGDAAVVEREYLDRCDANWSCLGSSSDAGAGEPSSDDAGESATNDDGESATNDEGTGSPEPPHMGVYLLSYFPYADGPPFVQALREGDDWDGVNAAYDSPPESSTEVIDPGQYGDVRPRSVSIPEPPSDEWERVRPPNRQDYAVLGQSALGVAFAYTLYDDYNRSSVVSPRAFLNVENGLTLNRTDPLNYGLAPTQGWRGDRLHVYRSGSQTGYVWRLSWASSTDATRFASGYRSLLRHWGGEPVAGNVWRIGRDSPFTDAFYLEVEDETVTIVNAPRRADLGALYSGAG